MKTKAIALSFLLGSLGCSKQETIQSMPTWNGLQISPIREISAPDTAGLNREGFPMGFDPLPIRLLEFQPEGFPGSIRLLEFAGELEAYAGFQSFGDAEELAMGWIQNREIGNYFRKGKWIGRFSPEIQVERPWFQSNLALPGAGEWGKIPSAFASLLHSGRIPRSERVLTRKFLGLKPPVPVLAIRMDCHGDSAFVFAAPRMPIQFSEQIAKMGHTRFGTKFGKGVFRDSSNLPSLRLENFGNNLVGVEGCSDTAMVSVWITAQGNALKSRNFGM